VQAVIVKSECLRELLPVTEQSKSVVIPNGVNTDSFKFGDKQSARRKLGLSQDIKYILFPYDPDRPRKNFDLLKTSVDRANECSSANIEIFTLCEKPVNDVIMAMQACDCLAITSHWEGSPNVVKEAMAIGLPIVSVDVGDVAEIIKETIGCFVTLRDPVSFSQCLLKAVNTHMPTNGPENIQYLSTESVAQRVISVYQQVVDLSERRLFRV